jgi:arsenical pump membrane protein
LDDEPACSFLHAAYLRDSEQSAQRPSDDTHRSDGRLGWALGTVGLAALLVASTTHPADARSAAGQNWSPFILVTGLLLIGLVADDDGLFAAAGHRLAHASRSGIGLFLGAALMIGVVTALLNLDTSVAFLTPVLVYTARSRGEPDAPLLFGSILLANAGSLFLPGSNLTNLIVLGHFHVTGGQFFGRMWLPALVALVTTAAVIAFFERRSLRLSSDGPVPTGSPKFGVGVLACSAAAALVVLLSSPALPVLSVGVLATMVRLVRGEEHPRRVLQLLGIPLLVGLFGLAVGLGTLGRVWSGPEHLLSHLDAWGTAAIAAISTVLLNNLPAASLLAARTPRHPYSLLIGLNLGPNLFVTGSLAWVLWLRSARTAGARPSIAGASRLGLVAVPLSIAAAVGVSLLAGSN